eukprot:gene6898-7676_t
MHLSFFNASWIVTAKAIGQIFGSVIIGRISDLYGRKRTLLVFLILEVVAYSLNALSNGYTMIIITRTIIESPRFLFKSGQIKETVLVLTKIAKINKYNAQDFAEFVEASELDTKQTKNTNSLDSSTKDASETACLLKKKKLSKTTILKLFTVVGILEGVSTFLANFVDLAAVQFREILPTSHRTLGLGVGRAIANIGVLISTVSVDYLYHVNKYVPFGIAHGLTLSALIVAIFFLRETKDVPLDHHEYIEG